MDLQELVEAALLEQHRWEFNCEYMYRKGLRSVPIDRACLLDMLRTFGVARNLSRIGTHNLYQKLPKIAECHRLSPHDWKTIFQLTSEKSIKTEDRDLYIEGSPLTNREPRAFVSGLTKVLWFAGSHEMPMFDRFTCNAVRPAGDTQAAKAADYFTKLIKYWGYQEVYDKINLSKINLELSWCFFPERFLDKILFLKGLDRAGFADHALMGTQARRDIYLQSLSEVSREELKALCSSISCNIKDTSFLKKLGT